MVNKSQRLDRTFFALADPTRRQIVRELARGQISVAHLAASRGVTVAAVLKHLHVLERAGLIRSEKIGRRRHCALTPEPIRDATDWLDFYRSAWESRLDHLEQHLNSVKRSKP